MTQFDLLLQDIKSAVTKFENDTTLQCSIMVNAVDQNGAWYWNGTDFEFVHSCDCQECEVA